METPCAKWVSRGQSVTLRVLCWRHGGQPSLAKADSAQMSHEVHPMVELGHEPREERNSFDSKRRETAAYV